MGINILQTGSFQFESQENLKNAARNILKRQGYGEKNAERILEKNVFDNYPMVNNKYADAQLGVINSSIQISVNNSLRETLKYLRTRKSQQPTKKAVLGELWKVLDIQGDEYSGELLDFEIDMNAKNIFDAA